MPDIQKETGPVPDDELEPGLRAMVEAYRQPPVPDREAMWHAIGAGRRALPAGLAALLALGFGLGRWTATAPPGVPAAAQDDLVHRVAADDYLGRVEVFLTDFRAGAQASPADSAVSIQARRLLGTTRLLLDTPAGDDRRLRPLLEELELVLAQIAQLPAGPEGELELINQGLDRQGTLARIRSKVTAGPMPAISQGAL
jgi:hypothetical protein